MRVFYGDDAGAFVAGLDAGLVYNSFPKMADRWIPSDLLALEPLWKNIFENPTTVQFNHRLLVSSFWSDFHLQAMTTYASIVGLWIWSRRLQLPRYVRLATNTLLAVGSMQVGSLE